MSMNTSQLRSAWAPACNTRNLIKLPLYGAGWISVDKRLSDAVHYLNLVLVKHGYRTRLADTGAYNCRKITGGTGYSLHSYGCAIDINWQSNPYMSNGRLVTDMPRAMTDEIQALRTNNGKRVWEWGGGWSGAKDAMHFEADASPADYATGIKNPQQPLPPQPPAPDWAALAKFIRDNRAAMGSFGTLRQGEANAIQVGVLQACLKLLTGNPTTIDGDWGPATMTAVTNFQKFLGLAADGVVGDATRFWICAIMDKNFGL